MIFSARQLQEKCQEQNVDLYMTFVDLTKAFGTVSHDGTNVWERKGIRLDTKLKVYNAVVLPILLYARRTWTVYQRHAKKLNHFHLSCLRKLLKISLQDKIPDIGVLKKAKRTYSTEACTAKMDWPCHKNV